MPCDVMVIAKFHEAEHNMVSQSMHIIEVARNQQSLGTHICDCNVCHIVTYVFQLHIIRGVVFILQDLQNMD